MSSRVSVGISNVAPGGRGASFGSGGRRTGGGSPRATRTRARPVLAAVEEYSRLRQSSQAQTNRRSVLSGSLLLPSLLIKTLPAEAAGECTSKPSQCGGPKLTNLSPEAIKEIVLADITERKFLATANFTPEIYSPDCTFSDEIDSYGYDEFVKGTSSLFDGNLSTLELLGDISADKDLIRFRFSEDLAFNFGFLKPKMFLTGTLVLRRNPDTGLIESYKETWDQSPSDVIKTLHF